MIRQGQRTVSSKYYYATDRNTVASQDLRGRFKYAGFKKNINNEMMMG